MLVGSSTSSSNFSGYISGIGGLTVTGGTLVLSSFNSFTGNVGVTAGELILNSPNALPDGAGLTIGPGAELAFGQSPSPGDVASGAAASPTTVPEPGTLELLLTSGVVAAGMSWRKRRVR